MPSDSLTLPSHPASSSLKNILTLWTERRRQLDQDQEGQRDRLRLSLHELDDLWKKTKHRRRRQWVDFEKNDRASDMQWLERLRRIGQWHETLNRLKTRSEEIQGTVSSLRWFDRAQDLGKRLAAHLSVHIIRLEDAHTHLHAELEIWLPVLTAKETKLKEFRKKAEGYSGPFMVSRGRKQPEMDFLTAHLSQESDFGSQLQDLRRGVALSLGRLYRAAHILEDRAQINEGLFDICRKQIAEDLKDIQNQYFGLREKVLADALFYESCRRKLRWIKAAVNEIRCIEDVYKAPEPAWKKILGYF